MADTAGARSRLSCDMPFIVSSNAEKADQATRKMIRSHVMRGKKAKTVKRLAASSGLAPAAEADRRSTQVNFHDVISMLSGLQPSYSFLHPHFFDFPGEIEPSVLWEMQQVSSVAMRIIFPLLMGIGFHPPGQAWYFPTGNDAAAWHINAFAIQSFVDRILRSLPRHKVNPVATLHYLKGLRILRQRLEGNDDEAKVSDATISAVLKLASAAAFDGHIAISQQHMHGLRKMTDLRGGLKLFGHNTKLLVEIWRCDLSIALLADSDPIFYSKLRDPMPEYPSQLSSTASDSAYCSRDRHLTESLHQDLADIWGVMRRFCLLANLGTQTHMLLEPAAIYETMTAVMYRVLHMKFEAGTLDEAVRLGVLTFTNHIFLQWEDLKLPDHPFSELYRRYLQKYALDEIIPPHISLWLLMIGALSTFSVADECWLRNSLRMQVERCEIRSWIHMLEILKSSLWISLLDEKHGKHIYDAIAEVHGPSKGNI